MVIADIRGLTSGDSTGGLVMFEIIIYLRMGANRSREDGGGEGPKYRSIKRLYILAWMRGIVPVRAVMCSKFSAVPLTRS